MSSIVGLLISLTIGIVLAFIGSAVMALSLITDHPVKSIGEIVTRAIVFVFGLAIALIGVLAIIVH